jgi:taurine dioxygenase
MYRAYETLSDPIKEFLAGMTAIHDGKHVFDREGYRESRSYPRAEHPIVRTHPVTGRQALFVNRVFTTQIVGLGRNESDSLLQMLFRHVETPELYIRLNWRPNTLACWDNRCTQHRALFDYFPNRRYGQRVTVVGDKPFYRAAAATSVSAEMTHA